MLHCLQCDNLGKCTMSAFTLSHFLQSYNQLEVKAGWTCSNGPHMFLYVDQSHRHNSTCPGLFISGGAFLSSRLHHTSSRWQPTSAWGMVRMKPRSEPLNHSVTPDMAG